MFNFKKHGIFFNDKKYSLDLKTKMQPKSEDEKNLKNCAEESFSLSPSSE